MNPAAPVTPRRRVSSLVIGIALIVAVGVLAYMLGAARAHNEPSVLREQAVAAPASYAGDLAGMRADLRDLRDQLLSAVPRPDLRTPAVPVSDTDAKLLAAIERLEAAISRLDPGFGRPVSQPHDPDVLARLGAELRSLNPGPKDSEGNDPLFDWMNQHGKELTARHLLWTLDEVLAAYGPPTSVETGATDITLHYDIRQLADERIMEVQFRAKSLRIVDACVTWR
jgi:hypothetical protein